MNPQEGLGAKVKFQGNLFTVAEYNILRTHEAGAAERMLCMKSSAPGGLGFVHLRTVSEGGPMGHPHQEVGNLISGMKLGQTTI